MSDSIFTRIIKGEIPCHRVYDHAQVIAFLDVNPLCEGHALVVPKRQVERLEGLAPAEAAALGEALVIVAAAVLKVTGAAGYNVLQNNGAVAGQVVPHVHFHIIPRRDNDGLGYRWNAKSADAAALAALAARISSALA